MSDTDPLLDLAAELAEAFRERSDEIEAARRIPADVSLRMADAGFYRMGAPQSIGGLETAPATSSEVFEILARGDASCAWVAFIGMTSSTALAALPASSAQAILADPQTLVTGVFAPTGAAERCDGGFRVSGRWQWGSGSQNAQWVLGGCQLLEAGEPMRDAKGRPRSTMVLMPTSEIRFDDTWHTSGLCGSGSLDYEADDVFVPDDRVVGFCREGLPPLTPLSAFPNFSLLALGIGAVCMGIARAAIDDLVELATAKARTGSRKTIAERSASQAALAQAEADLRSARQLFYATLDEAWNRANAGEAIDLPQRRDLRLATTNAVMRSVGVVDAMVALAGGTAVYRSSRLQRQFRDIHVAKSHIMVAPSTLEVIGASLFGIDANFSML